MTLHGDAPLVLVDTSAWICYFARQGFPEIKQAISIILDDDRVAMAGPIFVELIQGCRTLKEKNLIQKSLGGLNWLEVESNHWHKAADLAFGLRRKGITVPVIDALIASLAMAYGASLLHRDSHYEQIANHFPLKLFAFLSEDNGPTL